IDGEYCGGLITETEAYNGIDDKASHAYGNRRTPRTETMYMEGGHAYIYLCYGIHHLFNVVTHAEGIPHAVLIRALFPDTGILVMQERRKYPKKAPLCGGPGTLSQALGLRTNLDKSSLLGKHVWIEETGIRIREEEIKAGPR